MFKRFQKERKKSYVDKVYIKDYVKLGEGEENDQAPRKLTDSCDVKVSHHDHPPD